MHTDAEIILGRKLFKGGFYMRKYGSWLATFNDGILFSKPSLDTFIIYSIEFIFLQKVDSLVVAVTFELEFE